MTDTDDSLQPSLVLKEPGWRERLRGPALPECRPAAHTWLFSAWGAVSAELWGNKRTWFHLDSDPD